MVLVHKPGRIALMIGVTVPICQKPHRRRPAGIGNESAISTAEDGTGEKVETLDSVGLAGAGRNLANQFIGVFARK